MSERAGALRRLERALGHRFRTRELLEQALRHPSAAHEQQAPSYDRLEFLGDAALSHAVAELLYRAWPDATEGELTRARAALVRESALVTLASRLDVAGALEVGGGLRESVPGPALLANALEAVLGALLLDSSWLTFSRVVARLWRESLEGLERGSLRLQEPKTVLQELAQKSGLPLPVYREVGQRGPEHGLVFVYEVLFDGRVAGRGEGSSKRAAQQAAARQALGTLQPPGGPLAS